MSGQASLIRGKRVWSVDDILTFGATVSTFTRMRLRVGGAGGNILTIARVP
jgi:predicted amidophosphoribosyltransferase